MRPTRLTALLFAGAALPVAALAEPHVLAAPDAAISLSVLGQHRTGVYNESAAEIVTYDPGSRRGFTVNAASGEIDVLDLSDPANPTLIATIDVSDVGAAANSVAVRDGIVAVAVEAETVTDPGSVVFMDTEGARLATVEVGALPDALTFSPDGRWVLVANEGEPREDYTIDPEGSISIIDLSDGAEALTQDAVRTADFTAWNGREDELRAQGVRIFGPGATAAKDFEPEWIEVAPDGATAYAALQENNAIAVIDVESATVTAVHPLPMKDWSEGARFAGAGFDASRDSGEVDIRPWPVMGILQPDAIRVFEADGATYIVTANEGDARAYDVDGWWLEEFSVEDLRLDPDAFPNAAELQGRNALGRLNVTSTLGVANDCDPSLPTAEVQALGFEDVAAYVTSECVYDALYAYGGRSMSIFRVGEDGLDWVWDSGSQMEETIAAALPEHFNADHQFRDEQFKRRSPNKGPEPEGVALGTIGERTYAFVGLERIGGVMVYDVTVPEETAFVKYVNNRDFTVGDDEAAMTATDLGAEGLHFIPADASPDPDGRPLLMVGNEVSGTTTLFAIDAAD
jgi:hypothetical protein